MIEIEFGTEAGNELARIMADKDTYMIRIWPCHDDVNGNGYVKFKRNEEMWTPPLKSTNR